MIVYNVFSSSGYSLFKNKNIPPVINNKIIKANDKEITIKHALIKADVVTLSIGMNDLMYKLNIANEFDLYPQRKRYNSISYHKNRMKEIRGGSPYWMAPEILRKEEYSQNIDIWALGITCIELAEYEPPYSDFSTTDVIKQIIKCPPKGLTNPKKWSKEFNDFVKQCLILDKNRRPMSDELLKHDFITIIDKKNLNRKLIILNFL